MADIDITTHLDLITFRLNMTGDSVGRYTVSDRRLWQYCKILILDRCVWFWKDNCCKIRVLNQCVLHYWEKVWDQKNSDFCWGLNRAFWSFQFLVGRKKFGSYSFHAILRKLSLLLSLKLFKLKTFYFIMSPGNRLLVQQNFIRGNVPSWVIIYFLAHSCLDYRP